MRYHIVFPNDVKRFVVYVRRIELVGELSTEEVKELLKDRRPVLHYHTAHNDTMRWVNTQLNFSLPIARMQLHPLIKVGDTLIEVRVETANGLVTPRNFEIEALNNPRITFTARKAV